MAGKAAWVDVLPNMSAFAKTLMLGTNSAAAQAGRNAGKSFSTAMNAASASDILKGQVDSMKAALAKAETAVVSATRNIAAARDKEKAADLQVAAAEAKVNEQTAKYGANSSQALKAQAQLTTAQSKAAKAADEYADAQKQITAASKAKTEATTALAAKESEYSAVVAKQPSAVDRMTTSVTKASKSTGLFRNALSGAKGMIATFGVTAAAVSLTAWVKDSLGAAEDFQKQMNLLVTAGGESQSALNKVAAGIKQIAVQTGESTTELAEGMYTMEKAQIRGADGLKVLKAAAQGATDEQVSLSVMTNALTSIMRSYNIPASQASSVTNQLVAASGEAKTTMQEFAGSLSTVLPVASSAGLSFAQVGGAIATLTSHGTSAQESTQELSNTIRALQAPNNVAVKEMQQFGISSVDVAQNLGKNGLTGTISYLSQTILKNMGSSGTILLKTFNQSSTAAADANTMYSKLTGSAKTLATGVKNGTVTLADYRKQLKALPATQANLVQQWDTLYNKSKGFNDQLKSGSPAAQTYTDALKKIMGGATGMNTALMLSGGSTKTFQNNVAGISKVATKNAADISTWAETQSTAKVQTGRFNQMLNTISVTLAAKFLPAITNTMSWLTNTALAVAAFTAKHQTLVRVLGVAAASIAGLVVGFKLLRTVVLVGQGIQVAFATATGATAIAQDAAAISAGSYAAAQGVGTAMATAGSVAMTALGAAIDFATGPIGIIIAAIGLLAVGFKLAYDHSATFRNIVNTAISDVKNIALAVGNWFQTSFVAFFKTAFGGVKNAVTAVTGWFSGPFAGFFTNAFRKVQSGAAALWNGMKTVGNGIMTVFKFMGTLITTILVTPWVVAFNLLKGPVLELWHNVIVPAWTAIRTAFQVSWNWIKTNIVDAWNLEIKAWGTIFKWLYNSVILPVWNGIKTAFQTSWNWIVTNVVNPVKLAITAVGNAFNAFWHGVVVPVWNGIKTAFSVAWNWIKTNVVNAWNREINGWATIFKWLYNSVILPVWTTIRNAFSSSWNWISQHVVSPFKTGINDIGQAFSDTGTWIKKSWDKVKDAAASPVRWVVNTVYTNGIEKVWNSVAKAVGLDLKLPNAPKFANGGINPGYAPGHDSIMAMTSPGEAWMVPEWTRAVGSDNIYRWNRIARQQGPSAVREDMMGYADGGVVPGFSVGGIVDAVGNFIGSVASTVSSFVSDPGGSISKWIVDPVKSMISNVGGGDWGSMVAKLPLKSAQALVSKATSLWNSSASSSSSTASTSGQVASYSASAGVAQWSSYILQALSMLGQPASWLATVERRMNQESGGNPNAINLWDSNAKAGIPSQGLMQVIPPTFASYAGSLASRGILDPLANIYAGLNYALHRYGSLSALNQAGGYAEGGVVPSKLYDTGGWLPPGRTLVENHTGAPELVLNGKQQDLLLAGRKTDTSASGSSGIGGRTVNLYYTNAADPGLSSEQEFTRNATRAKAIISDVI